MSRVWLFVFIFIAAAHFRARAKDKKRDTLFKEIYRDIDDMDFCVRLTNATHTIGCATGPNGNTGTLYIVSSEEDIDWVLRQGMIPPYVPLIDQDHFYNRTFMMHLKKPEYTDRISGVIADFVSNGYHYQGYGSPAHKCPSQGFGGLYSHNKTCNPVWNPHGSSLAFESFSFPVFAIRSKMQLDSLKNCSLLFNQNASLTGNSYPACQVRMRAFMAASVDTPTCMRKNSKVVMSTGFCDPLENPSFWGSLFSPTTFDPTKPVVMVSAKMDASSFFHRLTFGANNDASGMVTLLAALEALGDAKRKALIKENSGLKPIVFAFFNGEEWDYIGSSRMVFDLQTKRTKTDNDGEVPVASFLSLDRIESFLDIGQVGIAGDGPIFAHKANNAKTSDLFDKLSKYASGGGWTLSSAQDGQDLPPSSLLQFLNGSQNSIGGVVLADHDGEYKNKYYGSSFDDAEYLNISHISSQLTLVATAVAKALLSLSGAADSVVDTVKAKENTTQMLLHCFLEEMNCSLFQQVSTCDDGGKLKKEGGARYISVSGNTPNAVPIVRKLAILYTGINVTSEHGKEGDCSDASGTKPKKDNYLNSTLWFRKSASLCDPGSCYVGHVFTVNAKSPAFILGDYGSKKYSTWAESRWDVDPTLTFYVAASDHVEDVTLGLGVTITFVSFVIALFARKRVESLFVSSNDSL